MRYRRRAHISGTAAPATHAPAVREVIHAATERGVPEARDLNDAYWKLCAAG